MGKREIDGCAGMPYEHHRAPRPKCRFIIKIDRVESATVDLDQDVGDIKSIMQVIERHPVTSVISMLWAPLPGAPAGTRISRSPSAEGDPVIDIRHVTVFLIKSGVLFIIAEVDRRIYVKVID